MRAKWDRRAVRNGQAAHREVDHQPRVLVRREGVAVYRALGSDGELAADAGAEGRGVVARLRPLVVQLPGVAEAVEWLQHRRNPEVVVVLADRSGTGLLEMGET